MAQLRSRPDPLRAFTGSGCGYARLRRMEKANSHGYLLLSVWSGKIGKRSYYTLLGGFHVYSSTINQLPTQEGVKVRISTVNIKGMV